MQGYCQISQFSIPSEPAVVDEDSLVDYILISRRSRYRPGLRYQRRGIDDEAHVANFVETETIMRVEVSLSNFLVCDSVLTLIQREAKENVFAYVQIRGSGLDFVTKYIISRLTKLQYHCFGRRLAMD